MNLPDPASKFFGDLAIEALQTKKYTIAKKLTNIASTCDLIERIGQNPFDFPGQWEVMDWMLAARKLVLKGYDELPDHPEFKDEPDEEHDLYGTLEGRRELEISPEEENDLYGELEGRR